MSQVYIREADESATLEVYRCGNSHWHYMPHKYDDSAWYIPWYRKKLAPFHDGKFHSWDTVYVQGHGSDKFRVKEKHESGFYCLKTDRGEVLCTGRYGQEDRMLYREEELSLTPWVDAKGPPPAYEESPSGKDGDEKDEKAAPTKN